MMSGSVLNDNDEMPRMLMLALPAPGAPEPPRIWRPGVAPTRALVTLVAMCFSRSLLSNTVAAPVKALFFCVPKATTMTSSSSSESVTSCTRISPSRMCTSCVNMPI